MDKNKSSNKIDLLRLVQAGPNGLAAAAAIVSNPDGGKYIFETDPVLRKRLINQYINKLKLLTTEYSTRTGLQAVTIIYRPTSNENEPIKIYGTKPLDDIILKYKQEILVELESILNYTTNLYQNNHARVDLPPLTVDGIPTSLQKMTQGQLRCFIPYMLKYDTGRGKPGWGNVKCMPPWWPSTVPWANIRADVRSEEDKRKVSWTDVLRDIIRSCYAYHNRLDLLGDTDTKTNDEIKSDDTITNASVPIGSNSSIEINGSSILLTKSNTPIPAEDGDNTNPIVTTKNKNYTKRIKTSHKFSHKPNPQSIAEIRNLRNGTRLKNNCQQDFITPNANAYHINSECLRIIDNNQNIISLPLSSIHIEQHSAQTPAILAQNSTIDSVQLKSLLHEFEHGSVQNNAVIMENSENVPIDSNNIMYNIRLSHINGDTQGHSTQYALIPTHFNKNDLNNNLFAFQDNGNVISLIPINAEVDPAPVLNDAQLHTSVSSAPQTILQSSQLTEFALSPNNKDENRENTNFLMKTHKTDSTDIYNYSSKANLLLGPNNTMPNSLMNINASQISLLNVLSKNKDLNCQQNKLSIVSLVENNMLSDNNNNTNHDNSDVPSYDCSTHTTDLSGDFSHFHHSLFDYDIGNQDTYEPPNLIVYVGDEPLTNL